MSDLQALFAKYPFQSNKRLTPQAIKQIQFQFCASFDELLTRSQLSGMRFFLADTLTVPAFFVFFTPENLFTDFGT